MLDIVQSFTLLSYCIVSPIYISPICNVEIHYYEKIKLGILYFSLFTYSKHVIKLSGYNLGCYRIGLRLWLVLLIGWIVSEVGILLVIYHSCFVQFFGGLLFSLAL